MDIGKQMAYFYRYLDTSDLSASARLLWYTLAAVSQSRVDGRGLRIRCGFLLERTGLKKTALYHAREELVQAGLLEVRQGEGQQQAAFYRLIPMEQSIALAEEVWLETAAAAHRAQQQEDIARRMAALGDEGLRERMCGGMGERIPARVGERADGQGGERMGGTYKEDTEDTEDDEEELMLRRARQFVAGADAHYKGCFGRSASPAELEQLARWHTQGYPGELIFEALDRAALAAARSPVSYAFTCLENWRGLGLVTLRQLERHEAEMRGEG